MSQSRLEAQASRSVTQVQVRDKDQYPSSLNFVLNIVTINEDPRVVGSAAYLEHKYPGDVDVFEAVVVRAGRDEALQFYADQFRTIAQQLTLEQKRVYFLEFKAGLDERYKFVVNEAGSRVEREVILNQLKTQELLTDERFGQLYGSLDSGEDFKEVLRQLVTVRWSLPELSQGFKSLPFGQKITLQQALAMDTVVKMDVVSWIDNRLQSVEPFYWLRYEEDGQIKEFLELDNYVMGIVDSIQHYGQPQHYNPLKIIKRLWNLSRVIRCQELLDRINPLLSSDAAALNQIVSDIEIISEMIQRYESPPWDPIFLELLGFKKRLFNHLDFETYRQLVVFIDQFHIQWGTQRVYNLTDRGQILTDLKTLSIKLKPIIAEKAQVLLKEIKKQPVMCGGYRIG